MELVYPAGSAVVIYRSKRDGSGTQSHYLEHDDDVLCVDVHPDGRLAASGQVRNHAISLPPISLAGWLATAQSFGTNGQWEVVKC